MSAEVKSMSLDQMLQGFIPNRRGRKPADLPVIRNGNGALLPRYLVEKRIGLRRENGAMKLKKLTARHLRIIGMHLEGFSVEQIAVSMPCSIPTVSRIVNDPLSQVILKRVYEDRQGELQSLGGVAIQAVREGLGPEQPIGVRLRAVDRYAKVRETMLSKDKIDESAEDVIARMLSRMNITAENVQVNIGTGNGVDHE